MAVILATSPLSSAQADTLSWKHLDLSGRDREGQAPGNLLLLSQRPAWPKWQSPSRRVPSAEASLACVVCLQVRATGTFLKS